MLGNSSENTFQRQRSQSKSNVTSQRSVIKSWCPGLIWDPRTDFYHCQTLAGLLMWGALFDERTGLSFTIAAGPRQLSYSQIRVPHDSWPYFIVSDSRLRQPAGPCPRIYIPQEQRGSVMTPGTGFPLHRLLRLAALRWSIRIRFHAGIQRQLIQNSNITVSCDVFYEVSI
jgi:hypothetical protein